MQADRTTSSDDADTVGQLNITWLESHDVAVNPV